MNDSSTTHDCVILGAGPSGAMAAYLLARAGRKVVLMDRAQFPRSKVCGDCLNPSAWALWERVGLKESFSKLPHHEIRGLALECEGREVFRQPFPHLGPRAITRTILDQWLVEQAEAAGAEFLPETVVERIDPLTGRVQTNRGEFIGARVFGADGRNSLAAKQTGLAARPRRCHRIAWQTTITAPERLDDYVHMNLFAEGYYGMTRINARQANLCFVLDSRRSQAALPIAQRFFPHIKETDWRRVNPISRGTARIGKGKLWLLGDAARVVEPFTGEGIYFALATGELAAQTALTKLKDEAALARYAKRHQALYAHRVWINTLVHTFLYRPLRAMQALQALRHMPGLLGYMSSKVHQDGWAAI